MKDELEIVGTLGRISISCFDSKPVEIRIGDDDIIKLENEHPATVQQPMIQLVTQELLKRRDGDCTIQESDLDPSVYLCDGESAARTSLAMDKLLGRERWSDNSYINK